MMKKYEIGDKVQIHNGPHQGKVGIVESFIWIDSIMGDYLERFYKVKLENDRSISFFEYQVQPS